MHEAAFSTNRFAGYAGVGTGGNPPPASLGDEMTILKTRRSRRDRILDLKAVAQSSNYHVEEMAHALGVTRRGLEHHLIRRDNTALKAWFAEIKVREGARLLEDGV